MTSTNAEADFVVNSKCRSHASSMSDSLKQAIGARVQAARRGAKLSQEALADRIGRTPESVSNIERGKQLPSIETLAELARVLNVPMTDFFEGLEKRRVVSRERALLEAELLQIARQLGPRLVKVALEQVKVLKHLG
ncbi:helix-turn-helix domain-containing protein [Mesorhizobium sp. BR1-1-9]|uniref:helix-turn-helix domain-containing protein n=1 Tax=unclassified Mesorhizobium TaxID=325217 RepID=UPI001CD0CEC2|nr:MULTISPECIES: helix-turn-helix transcriptional regulator [unclassified Mesorhizobium]MBZ9873183.1 helix-turn-helix domain-containing protein [Mesorhizobium sp. BR1-1-9]MBZ9945006.1 helix-turn-helix domain-containing protein [Mesorhizobium sp. BR1-1-13]